MKKTDSHSNRKGSQSPTRWVITVFVATLFVSGGISLLSESLLARSGMAAAFLILLAIVAVGILFDMIGVSVTAADERPFHAMAARKVFGAQEAIRLLRNAGKVSSICCDVVGDICGVVSGSASAAIAARILGDFTPTWPKLVTLGMSAMIAGLTVGGKALGKTAALNNATSIVHTVGELIAYKNRCLLFLKGRNRAKR